MNVDFHTKVQDASNNLEAYRSDHYWQWLRDLGERVFGQGRTILTVVHLGKLPGVDKEEGADHWVPLIIDGKERCFRYGDSLTKNPTPPPELKTALELWSLEHTNQPFSFKTLPITYQIDGHSCGPLAYNALEHFVLPKATPLVSSNEAACVRMLGLLDIIDYCDDLVRELFEIQVSFSPWIIEY